MIQLSNGDLMYRTWNDLWAHAYQDGANKHHLSGRRLDMYAHCYADVTEGRGKPLPLECFWLGWQRDAYEPTPEGNWHLREIEDTDDDDHSYYDGRWAA